MNHEQLTKFCATGDIRFYLNEPFMTEGYAIATDSSILIRTKEFEREYPDKHEKMKKNINEMIEKQQSLCLPLLPIPELSPVEKCPDCGGTGKTEDEKCDECDGDGEFARGGYNYECQNCDGTGKIDIYCGKCRGGGYVIQSVPVGDACFSNRYLALIAELPNARIAPNGKDEAAYFTFDGGDGLLMPRRE
ncbi:MAG: hypothetical protein FWH15_07710 [Betaproteobacteria bacterium]|nr:hypothetical protein [Betaproteobacteria bacterium]